jgi:hypothetical protein
MMDKVFFRVLFLWIFTLLFTCIVLGIRDFNIYMCINTSYVFTYIVSYYIVKKYYHHEK